VSSTSESDAELKRQVLASLAATPAPARASVRKARLSLFGCGAAGALAIFFIEGGLRPFARPPSMVALGSAGAAAIAGTGMWLLLTRGRRMLGRPIPWLAATAIASALAFLAWRYGLGHLYGSTQRWTDRPGLRCLEFSVTVGAPPLLAALLAWRRTIAVSPFSTGAAFGAGAGLGSAFLVDLWCPVSYLPHLLLGHLLPIGLLAISGGVVGSRVLRLRWRR
jgi:hypothetical protein